MAANQTTSLTLAALTLNLRRLCIIRAIVLLFMAAAAIYGYLHLDIGHQLIAVAIILSGQALLTAITYLRCRSEQMVTERNFALQLVADVAFIFALAYFTGGATNPFVSYFLVPLSIAAATLPWRHVISIALLSVAAYTALLFVYQPLPFFSHTAHNSSHSSAHSEHGNHSEHAAHAIAEQLPLATETVFNAHYLGMWFNFLVSAVLIAWFVAQMAEAIRDQQKAINQAREQRIYDEQILSIATLAAGTAHELGTPVNSLSLLIDEMDASLRAGNSKAMSEDIALMQNQLEQCRNSLKKLVHTAQQTQPGEMRSENISQLLSTCVERWHNLRPEVVLENKLVETSMNIDCDETLTQAITNLLNNAANASPDFVSIEMHMHDDSANIIIRDWGDGVSEQVLEKFGKEPIPNQPLVNGSGLGFGLLLASASVQRHGGELFLENDDNGAKAIIALPIFNPNT